MQHQRQVECFRARAQVRAAEVVAHAREVSAAELRERRHYESDERVEWVLCAREELHQPLHLSGCARARKECGCVRVEEAERRCGRERVEEALHLREVRGEPAREEGGEHVDADEAVR